MIYTVDIDPTYKNDLDKFEKEHSSRIYPEIGDILKWKESNSVYLVDSTYHYICINDPHNPRRLDNVSCKDRNYSSREVEILYRNVDTR